MTMVLTGNAIHQFRLVALKHALKLEVLGMHHSSGRRASVEVRKVLTGAGVKPARSLATLLDQYQRWLAGQA